MRKYGIYLAYSPNQDPRNDGLGRFLTEFLSAAREREDVRFVVGCPSWMRPVLLKLFEEVGARSGEFELISPRGMPLLVRLWRYYEDRRKCPRKWGWGKALWEGLILSFSWVARSLERVLVNTRSAVLGAILVLALMPFLALAALTRVLWIILRVSAMRVRRTGSKGSLRATLSRIRRMFEWPQGDRTATRLYRALEEEETDLLVRVINSRTDVDAWYCPAAFWPSFNRIQAPRLMAVPDVVVGEFPSAFSSIHGDKLLAHFKRVESSILGGSRFVTFSQRIKQGTLVDRYFVPPGSVAVVPHGAMRLDGLVEISGFPDNREATENYCRTLFRFALDKAVGYPWASLFADGRVRFLFYASQFRPHKNILSLLKAYEFLLRRRYLGHKLVLTGDPREDRAVGRFVREHRLENEVLFLKGLSERELAACYKLADLAVNPSLSEGGCPFTLTEALSVGTPVVMARIPVTEEVLIDPLLREKMLFDPYDWKDMAARIEWGVKNRTELFALQEPFFKDLSQRDWGRVVGEYVKVLDGLATEKEAAHAKR